MSLNISPTSPALGHGTTNRDGRFPRDFIIKLVEILASMPGCTVFGSSIMGPSIANDIDVMVDDLDAEGSVYEGVVKGVKSLKSGMGYRSMKTSIHAITVNDYRHICEAHHVIVVTGMRLGVYHTVSIDVVYGRDIKKNNAVFLGETLRLSSAAVSQVVWPSHYIGQAVEDRVIYIMAQPSSVYGDPASVIEYVSASIRGGVGVINPYSVLFNDHDMRPIVSAVTRIERCLAYGKYAEGVDLKGRMEVVMSRDKRLCEVPYCRCTGEGGTMSVVLGCCGLTVCAGFLANLDLCCKRPLCFNVKNGYHFLKFAEDTSEWDANLMGRLEHHWGNLNKRYDMLVKGLGGARAVILMKDLFKTPPPWSCGDDGDGGGGDVEPFIDDDTGDDDSGDDESGDDESGDDVLMGAETRAASKKITAVMADHFMVCSTGYSNPGDCRCRNCCLFGKDKSTYDDEGDVPTTYSNSAERPAAYMVMDTSCRNECKAGCGFKTKMFQTWASSYSPDPQVIQYVRGANYNAMVRSHVL